MANQSVITVGINWRHRLLQGGSQPRAARGFRPLCPRRIPFPVGGDLVYLSPDAETLFISSTHSFGQIPFAEMDRKDDGRVCIPRAGNRTYSRHRVVGIQGKSTWPGV